MTMSLWQLVSSTLQHEAVNPLVEKLLDNVNTDLIALTGDLVDAGEAAADDVWAVVRGLVPVPPDLATPPDIPGNPTVKAHSLGGIGWEVVVSLQPTIRIELPADLVAPGELTSPGGEQHIDPRPGGGHVSLVLTGSGANGTVEITLKSPSGTAVDISFGSLGVSVDPPEVSLPFGFGVKLGTLTVGPNGINLPDVEFYLPRLPKISTGAIPCPVQFGRSADQLANVVADIKDVSFPAPWAGTGVDLKVDLKVSRPDGRTLADLLPTEVTVSVPLGDAPIKVPTENATKGAATGGGPVTLKMTVTTEHDRALFSGSIEAAGDDRGIAVIPATDHMGLLVALVGALGKYLSSPASPVPLSFADLVAGAAGVAAVADSADALTTLQAVHITGSWTDPTPMPTDFRVFIDYESSFGVSVGVAAIKVSTRPGSPVRVRNRDVVLKLDQVRLDWSGAATTLVSIGDWHVEGIPDGLLRVAGVRGGQGSITLDLDLRVSIELGVVTVDQTTVRVTIDENGHVDVGPAGFGIGIDIPGTITGRGRIAFNDPGFEAALAVRLPSIGAAGRAAVKVGDGMVMVGVAVDLFAPIPFANSGIGLYGVGGVLAANARRIVDESKDPIGRELAWDPLAYGAWGKGDDAFLGFGARIGTVPDLGFALMADASILIGLPDPLLRVAMGAELMRGVGGTLLGIIVVNDTELTVALKGSYGIPHLLDVEMPAGATFPFTRLIDWETRIGGDRDAKRGEPVTMSVLPDLLRLEAWGFLMAFGNATTVVGAKLAPQGLQLDGLSLAFGAGVEIHWSAGPFSFDASGSVLVAITHRPPDPGSTERLWMGAALATFHGEVDLGPVSIGASADLDALLVIRSLVDVTKNTYYAKARACAKVDLWLTSIEGCVHLDIGTKPTGPVPAPESPLLRMVLVDRTGLVVAEASEGADLPTVWPDAVPIVCLSHWVAQSATYAGTQSPVGDSAPTANGWVGTRKLEYRFELRSARVFRVAANGVRTEVGGGWKAAWQVPLSANVYAGTAAPAEARTLALNSIDTHTYLQPATGAGAGFPGDPIAFLTGQCLPVPGPDPAWFAGEHATLPWDGPMVLPVDPAPATPDDLDNATLEVIDPTDGEVLSLADLELVALSRSVDNSLPVVEAQSMSFDVAGRTFSGLCWLPRVVTDELAPDVRVRLPRPARSGALYVAAPAGAISRVSDPANGEWKEAAGPAWAGLSTLAWSTPGDGAFDTVTISQAGKDPVGLIALSATSAAAVDRATANEQARQHTHDTVQDDATSPVPAQVMLEPDSTYEVELDLHWSGRSDSGEFSSLSDQAFAPAVRTYRFQTAKKSNRPAAVPAPHGSSYAVKDLIPASALASLLFDEHVLQNADLQRYIGAFVPVAGTVAFLCDDPVQVLFTVDHLPALCDKYGDTLAVVARRTDAPPGTPPDHSAPQVVAVPPPQPNDAVVVPLSIGHLSDLDQARVMLADAQEEAGSPCKVARPGGAVQPPFVLDPEASYRIEVTIDGPLEAPGAGVIIASSDLRTSRYRDTASMLLDLGLATPTSAAALGAIPLPPGALAAAGSLAVAAESFGDGFAAALDQLGLAGYEPARTAGPTDVPYDGRLSPRTSALWADDGAGSWNLVGVLIESAEPIERPGRIEVDAVRLGGVELNGRHWDAQRTRLLAIGLPQNPAGGLSLEVVVRDLPPGAAAPGPITYAAPVVGTPPALTGVLE